MKPLADLRPVRAELHRGDREDEHAEPAVAEDPLDPLERRHPDHDREPDTASTISQRYGRPERSCNAIATPPSSAASVIRFTISDETSAPSAGLEPDPFADRVEDRLPETAATRPHISE